MSRIELETAYIKIQKRIKDNLHLSDLAIAFISLLVVSFTGMIYDEHYFDVNPMSILTLERLREQLQKD